MCEVYFSGIIFYFREEIMFFRRQCRQSMAVNNINDPAVCFSIFALKQTADFFYRNRDQPVNMCILDAKKASDKVNHWAIAKKLSDRNVTCIL